MNPKDKTFRRQRAKKLMKKYEITHKQASDVVNGVCSLHEVLVEAKEQAKQEALISRYGLSKEESVQVSAGEVVLNELLAKKYSKDHIDETDAEPVLQDGFKGVFWLHGPKQIKAEVYDCERYMCMLLHKEGQETVQKHSIKAFSQAECVPSKLEDHTSSPILRIEERYRISNRLLFQFVLDETPLRVTLLGGLCFEGVLERVGRFECVLRTPTGDVVMMRHALKNIEERD